MRVVVPSVGYADMLAATLPAWRALLPRADLRVVTAPGDLPTLRVARLAGAAPIVVEAWTQDGASFNKAAALDQAFGFGVRGIPPAIGEPCLALDADVYPAGAVPDWLQSDALYGCARHLCTSPASLAAFQLGRLALTSLPRRNGGDRGAGYFQLFRYRSGLTFGSFPTAGFYDLAFHRQFPAVENLPGCAVLHLGRTSRTNWKGRRTLPAWSVAHG